MALGDNPVIPLFDPADDLSAAVSAAIGAAKFVKIGGNIQGGPVLDLSTPTSPLTKGNLIVVSACGAGDKSVGVTKWETAAADDAVGLFTGNQVVPMKAGANITAGKEVESDANGDPITLASGKANGICITGATSGGVAYIKLYA
jgi:hypothetical protein